MMISLLKYNEKVGPVVIIGVILLVRLTIGGDLGIEDRLKAEQLPECQACEALVTSFNKVLIISRTTLM